MLDCLGVIAEYGYYFISRYSFGLTKQGPTAVTLSESLFCAALCSSEAVNFLTPCNCVRHILHETPEMPLPCK